MRLVYLSPVPWSSFAQRPQKFAHWFHSRTRGEVLWVDPYPARFPRFDDLRRPVSAKYAETQDPPDWIQILKPFALPIEPLPGSGWVNALLWQSVFDKIEYFTSRADPVIVIGKPSLLAIEVLRKSKGVQSVYDAMDDFPAFHRGVSRAALAHREALLVQQVDNLWVSSTKLKERWERNRPDLQLVPNALDVSLLPAPKPVITKFCARIFGYVGTISAWFDWEWVIALAKARPCDVVRLIGPLLRNPPADLPENIELLSPLHHEAALKAMCDFDVGVIPFVRNELTASVDPIKFYEYRALGLPVISTDFGEMHFRRHEAGTFISLSIQDIGSLTEAALYYQNDPVFTLEFSKRNSWTARFDAVKLIPNRINRVDAPSRFDIDVTK